MCDGFPFYSSRAFPSLETLVVSYAEASFSFAFARRDVPTALEGSFETMTMRNYEVMVDGMVTLEAILARLRASGGRMGSRKIPSLVKGTFLHTNSFLLKLSLTTRVAKSISVAGKSNNGFLSRAQPLGTASFSLRLDSKLPLGFYGWLSRNMPALKVLILNMPIVCHRWKCDFPLPRALLQPNLSRRAACEVDYPLRGCCPSSLAMEQNVQMGVSYPEICFGVYYSHF